MKSAFAEGNYHMAEELADSINWKRVRNANSLIKAGEVYETAERYDDAKENNGKYICEATIVDNSNESKESIKKTFEITLLEGTDFNISFNK